MSENLTEWQALILWALLAEGGASYRSNLLKKKMIPAKDTPHREELFKAGLIARERRPGKGKGIWLEVTDEGWNVASQNLSTALPKSQTSSAILQAWLTRLQDFMQARGFALADILGPQRDAKGEAKITAEAVESRTAYAAVRDRVRDAYLELTGGSFNKRALLRELREKLKDIDRSALDEALKRMQREQDASLMQLDNRIEITDADRAAAIYFGHEPRHILWIVR